MNIRKNLENRIRGWLPSESKVPSQSSPVQMPKKIKTLEKRMVSFLRVIAGIVLADSYALLLLFRVSTLALILAITTLTFAVSWLLLKRTSNKNIVKIFRHVLFFILIFVVTFTSVGFYISYTSGYPSTYVPQIAYPDILDTSLMQHLKSLEQSTSFRFLQAEHFGSAVLTGLTIRSGNNTGWLTWTFYAKDVNVKITMGNNAGNAYHTNIGSPFYTDPLPANFPSAESIKENFDQIDALGLRWFYDRAVETYQNQTASTPTITNLAVDIGFDSVDNYQGITIVLDLRNTSQDNFGNNVYPAVFKVEFQPNGNILSTTI